MTIKRDRQPWNPLTKYTILLNTCDILWPTLDTINPSFSSSQTRRTLEKIIPASKCFTLVGYFWFTSTWINLVDLIAPRHCDPVFRSSSELRTLVWEIVQLKLQLRPWRTTIWISKLQERYPMQWGYHESFTDHRHSTYACLENHVEPQNQTLEIGNGWKGKLILQLQIWSSIVQSFAKLKLHEHAWTWMKLEVMSKHVPVRHFVDSNPSLHKTLPAAPSPWCSRWSLLWSPRVPCERKGEVWHRPGLTKLVSWWQFYVYVFACIQRVDKRLNGTTFATVHDPWPRKKHTRRQ